jgi:hypothetical protein
MTLPQNPDRTRALPANDPDDRELTISCGCALKNLRVAAADEGSGVRVQLLPELENPDLLARMSLSAQSNVNIEESQLAEAIDRRHTYRKPFSTRAVDRSILNQLIGASEREGANVHPLLAEEDRQQAVDLVTEGDKA